MYKKWARVQWWEKKWLLEKGHNRTKGPTANWNNCQWDGMWARIHWNSPVSQWEIQGSQPVSASIIIWMAKTLNPIIELVSRRKQGSTNPESGWAVAKFSFGQHNYLFALANSILWMTIISQHCSKTYLHYSLIKSPFGMRCTKIRLLAS